MKSEAALQGQPIPDEATGRHYVLGEGVEAPDLVAVKDFLRFCATTGKGVIKDKIAADSLNTFAEWFFAGFTRCSTPRFERLPSELFSRFLDTIDEHRGTLLTPCCLNSSIIPKGSS